MSGRANAAATQGACHNFTLHWISEMFNDPRPGRAGTRMSIIGQKRGEANPVLQKVFGSRWAEGGSSYKVADQMMIMVRGLTEAGLPIDYSAFNRGKLLENVKAPRESGMIYSFWFTGSVVGASGGAHTIGFFRSLTGRGGKMVSTDGQLVAYDPNFGEYRMDVIEFNYWFNQLMAMYGPVQYQMLKLVRRR